MFEIQRNIHLVCCGCLFAGEVSLLSDDGGAEQPKEKELNERIAALQDAIQCQREQRMNLERTIILQLQQRLNHYEEMRKGRTHSRKKPSLCFFTATSYLGSMESNFDLKLIPEYDGRNTQSVMKWLEKLELVCKLRKVDDVASVIPLRLTGGAFAVYLQLPTADRKKVDKVKEALLAAFAVDPYVAYEQFVSRKLHSGEAPDVYLAELRRLGSLFGGISEKALACAFVAGLPERVRQLLRAGSRMEALDLEQILARARAVLKDDLPSVSVETCFGATGSLGSVPVETTVQKCHVCLGPNHFARDCLARNRRDFSAIYDPVIKCWTATWKWSEGKEPGILENEVKAYSVPQEAKDLYESELQRWVNDGWLLPYDENKYGPAKGLIPLMAVVQQNKKKVRPVLDFRELNTYIDTFTADSDVCSDKLCEWRRQGVNVSVVDLAKAYLQIRIHESLWPYQTVYFKGQRYCLTRLGFGLNIAPMVMKSVLNCVLLQDPIVRKGTSAYIDDILVNEDIVKASRVEEHLRNFGLVSKPHQRLAEGARAFNQEQESLFWKRDNDLGDAPRQLTRRAVFSYCGRLLGHYPVCGWLRVAVAFIKRRVNKVTEGWDDVIYDDYIKMCLQELLEKVKKDDPVRGQWNVTGDKFKIWVDASSLALGVAAEVNGSIVEDASWLWKDDSCHINMAELDAVIKGLNLALAWKIQKVELMTDSSTVHRWISDGLLGKSRLKTKAASEMLIRRRLGIVLSLIEECDLQLSITLVSSANNKADSLTRVPQRWLRDLGSCHQDAKLVCASVVPAISDGIKEIHHAAGHPDVRTLYFVKKVHPGVTRRQVQAVVKCCEACQSIDPAPVKWQKGSLEVDRVWQRVGMDITHYDGQPYLTLIDCGPSRFAIWRRLHFQTSESIIGQLETVFYERGAPEELLTDNDTAFCSKLFADFAKKWCVHLNFRCAYVPSGNGIAERCHRTVKVIAARKGCSIAEAVYLYNLMPRDDCDSTTAPVSMLYSYPVRVRGVDPCSMNKVAVSGPYKVGDEVWVKPSNMRCNMQFERGKVTRVLSEQAVEFNGVPHHVRDLRSCSSQGLILSEETTDAEDEELLIQIPVHEDEGEEKIQALLLSATRFQDIQQELEELDLARQGPLARSWNDKEKRKKRQLEDKIVKMAEENQQLWANVKKIGQRNDALCESIRELSGQSLDADCLLEGLEKLL
ncbi:uncharacterized protein LOC135215948 [Macrobrachium nipponense]|uniref:uncharacterized protein LOC135215948 n=1 Tax=Macrobrachium nipponense TaxID=159736 RepID=UPI0030C889C6